MKHQGPLRSVTRTLILAAPQTLAAGFVTVMDLIRKSRRLDVVDAGAGQKTGSSPHVCSLCCFIVCPSNYIVSESRLVSCIRRECHLAFINMWFASRKCVQLIRLYTQETTLNGGEQRTLNKVHGWLGLIDPAESCSGWEEWLRGSSLKSSIMKSAGESSNVSIPVFCINDMQLLQVEPLPSGASEQQQVRMNSNRCENEWQQV